MQHVIIVLSLCALLVPGGSFASAQEQETLVVYAYDSFISWGLAEATMQQFEEANNCKVTLIAVGDAGQVLNRVILEKDYPQADIVVGIDNNYLAKALKFDILEPYRSEHLANIPEELIFDTSLHLTPFEYGYITFVYDTEKIDAPPSSLSELTEARWEGKVILEDPRTSSPGVSLLLWTIAAFGEDGYLDFWEKLKPSILTVTKGWDTAYGMFTSGEAPIVLSYATSPAYHVEVEQSTRYRAAVMEEGFYRQIEGMGIVKGAQHPELAKKFIDYILTEDFQQEIPLTQWVFPVNPDVELPQSFEYAAKSDKFLSIDPELIEQNYDRWLKAWTELMTR
ncbi:thiamine ABC transporter substrate-binding protein [candidate division KSB3 bacterium]|uniref:Thiamine ABC transporter substrate-binding protein n=1 Tax=candidate division KSB3 bacterium TaxID=2044937 RepID=A0A2G6E284_9BACT|nr:MAG: thiamine ABC transporter substrate-binding protein [candidate division KSB3 bacterium]PIE28733.1 MAG: thiamine ABC transporter substrate-binding protein [candidate division KSB3 bacterium]